ncbi:MAG: glycosyltransferase [Clostridia bacterium]|nr:glycosyltransferase [Clostridia bacterium]
MQNPERKKNVLFLISALYGGGAEKVCCLLASELAKTCHVTVAYAIDRGIRYPLDPSCETVLIPQMRVRFLRGYLLRAALLLKTVMFCRKLKKKRKIDVTVSLLLEMNQLNVLSRAGDRVITSERANPKKYQAEKFGRTRWIYGCSDYVVFQSEQIRHLYGKRVLKHSGVICNPVSVPCKAQEIRAHRIVTMGRLAAQKNQAMLICAFARFQEMFPDYTLSLYGEGELEEELRALIHSLKMESKVLLHGNVQQVHEQIRDAEMFILPSNYEGLSNALLECMAMGIACISTACEGSSDVIQDGENGLLVGIGDEDGLVNAMTRIAQDELLRRKLERGAIDTANRLFRRDVVMKEWERVIFDR